MTVFSVAATHIRLAAADEEHEHDLDLMVRGDTDLRGQLGRSVTAADVGWLAPHEWLWFAEWRSRWNVPLDEGLLGYLEQTSTGVRHARFRLRRLVMADPATIEMAAASGLDGQDLPGLRWLDRHATRASVAAPPALELMSDALQIGTDASWRSLRTLTASDGVGAVAVTSALAEFAERRRVDRAIVEQWSSGLS